MNIDKTDLALISALQKDGRTSYAQLAKTLGISVSTASKRLDVLIKKGVLKIQALPNPYKIQHDTAFICMNVSVDKIDDVCNYLKDIFNAIIVSTTFGRFNILTAIYFQSLHTLQKFISSELSLMDGINETEIFFVNDVKKLFSEHLKWRDTRNIPIDIDEVDQKIIEQLMENGRYSGVYLAKKLGISESSVSKKLAYLYKKDIIQIRAQVDTAMLGFHSTAYVFLRANRDRVDDICAQMLQHQEITSIMTLSNGYDIYLIIVARSTKELSDFIKSNLTPSSGITGIDTLIVGENIKRYYPPFDIEEVLLNIKS